MIEVFKYINSFSTVHHSKVFAPQTNSRTRHNGLTILSKRCNTDIGRGFFSNRVMRHWNDLPAEVVTTSLLKW